MPGSGARIRAPERDDVAAHVTDHRISCLGCRESRLDFPFTMAFQPIVDLRESRIDSHEALVRGPAGEGAGSVLARVNEENL